MLNIEAARKIGINACIDKLGREFVMKNKKYATSAYGERDDSVFCFVGVDDCQKTVNTSDPLVLDNESKFSYRVSCDVNLSSGVPKFIECVVPGSL